MWRTAASMGDRPMVFVSWAVGVSLFVHCMNFLAVSYFGQIMMMWYFALAIAISLDPRTRAWPSMLPAYQPIEAPRPLRRTPFGVPAVPHVRPPSTARF
jgi:hypothetical protein